MIALPFTLTFWHLFLAILVVLVALALARLVIGLAFTFIVGAVTLFIGLIVGLLSLAFERNPKKPRHIRR
jgi:uncharacterized membrane protein